jgi:predicted kinase
MRLIKFLVEGIEDKGIFKAVFLAGHPGSGKSYALKKINVGTVEPRVVNTDKAFLKKAQVERLGNPDAFERFREHWDKGWPLVRDDVKRVNKSQLSLYINSMLPLAVDGTSNSVAQVNRRKGLLEGFGYDTAMIWVDTDLETSLRRAAGRERHVDPEFIEQSYELVKSSIPFYKKNFQTFLRIPNNDGELTDDIIKKAFNKMNKFFNSPVLNPVGKKYIEQMRENGWKYLSPNVRDMSDIKKVVSVWYRS